ncbi:MAG: GNAT family N-acetyltransferase [Chloroflexota bacterium]
MQHPNHNELVNLIQSWYTRSDDSLDIQVETRTYGFYTSRSIPLQPGDIHIIQAFPQADIPAFLADAKQYFPNQMVRIFIHNRQIDADLQAGFLEANCQRENESVYLVHVGAAPAVVPIDGLQIEEVTAENIFDYQWAKLKAFADCEDDPPKPDIESGLVLRMAELKGGVRFFVGRIEGQVAGIISWYPGMDRLLLHLGTRVPFRNRGIANQLLCHAITDAYAHSCRSVMLFTDPSDTPIELYQRLGFTDEVYWMTQYRYQPKVSEG